MRIRRLLLWIVAGAAAYFAVFGGEYSLFELRHLERQRLNETAALDTLRREIDAMHAHADSLETDPAALERIARERYGMIRDGERLYRFVELPDAEHDDAESAVFSRVP